METSKLITGFSRPQQVLYFFEHHKEEMFSTQFMSQYVCNNFDLSKKKKPKSGIPMIQQVNNEVSSNISKFLDPTKYFKNRPYNFERVKVGKDYFYQYKENKNIKLPKIKYVNIYNKYKTDIPLQPTQLNFDFQAPIIEENILSPLQEDILAADRSYTIDDLVEFLMDKLKVFNIDSLEEINFISLYKDKKITINVQNL